MRPEDLAKALDPKTFKPFVMNMSNGEAYRITHPQQVIVERSRATIGIGRQRGHRWYEKVITCALLHIVSLDPMEESRVE